MTITKIKNDIKIQNDEKNSKLKIKTFNMTTKKFQNDDKK